MSASVLRDLASASLALRQLAGHAGAGSDADAASARSALAALYPEAAGAIPPSSAGTRQAYLDAIRSAGNRIAGAAARPLAMHGQNRYREGRYRDAVHALRLALTIQPDTPAASALFASALELSRARTGFSGAARQAAILAPLDATAWKLAMRASFALERMGEAAERARKHVLLEPGSWNGWFILARARSRGGRADHAVAALGRATVLDPAHPDTRRALARAHFRSGDFADALREFETLSGLGALGREHDFERARAARAAGRADIAVPLLDALEASDAGFAEKRRILELTARVEDLRAP